MATVAIPSAAGLATIGLSFLQGPRRIRTFAGEPPEGQLAALTRFVEENDVRPVIHAVFPLSEIRDAHELFSRRGVVGKVVLTL